VLPDGSFVRIARDVDGAFGVPDSEIRVVLNWFEELKRLAPVK
jgi:hypothetical protein